MSRREGAEIHSMRTGTLGRLSTGTAALRITSQVHTLLSPRTGDPLGTGAEAAGMMMQQQQSTTMMATETPRMTGTTGAAMTAGIAMMRVCADVIWQPCSTPPPMLSTTVSSRAQQPPPAALNSIALL